MNEIPMKAMTYARIALKKSIEHWRRFETGTRKRGERIGSKDCALCGLFLKPRFTRSLDCSGCPVFERSGRSRCRNTPYDAVESIAKKFQWSNEMCNSPEFLAAAKVEREYLESLLP